ncbi:MAG: saccharopine dehydrogenase NADP-binding domain-containing protein [Planctomycetes bacterium]|nr:saccharopine dehydrogenase NADP-binding domain-containing protein [Planctomycetota bacterium]
MRLVTVLGGYGVFGSRIASALAQHPDTRVRVVGRDAQAGAAFADRIGAEFRACDVTDIESLRRSIEGSLIVIHTAGPFQGNDFRVAELCVDIGSHYLDIADARAFVTRIGALDEAARRRDLFVSSGVSTVPAVTYAMVNQLRSDFLSIEEIQIAMSPGNQNPRGASAIAAILTYVGRPLRVQQHGQWTTCRGWGDARWVQFPPPVGRRRVYNCDVPDLDLFPEAWGARTVRFQAGVQLNIINNALSGIARLRRFFSMEWLHRCAPLFLKLSLLLSRFGSKNGSLAVWLRGAGLDGMPLERKIAIVTDNDGPAIPSSAAIVLAKKILDVGPPRAGAVPCMGFVTLDELAAYLRQFGVWIVRGDQRGWESHL